MLYKLISVYFYFNIQKWYQIIIFKTRLFTTISNIRNKPIVYTSKCTIKHFLSKIKPFSMQTKRNARPIDRKKTAENSNLWKTLVRFTNTRACTISTCAFPVWIFFEGGIYCFLCVIGCVCTWVVFYNRDSKERGWYSNRKPSFLLVDI